MQNTITNLLSTYIGTSFAKQLAFADFLGDRNWGVQISAGVATFGDDLTFPIQLLGTEADGDSSWLWAWANEQSNLPEHLLTVCHELKQLGIDNQIPELAEPNFPLENADGHTLALIASGRKPDCCYYRGPYDGGALFFLVEDIPADIVANVTPERALTTIGQCLSQFDLNHHLMVTSFLNQQGFAIEEQPGTLTGSREGSQLEISFDDKRRVSKMNGSLKPA